MAEGGIGFNRRPFNAHNDRGRGRDRRGGRGGHGLNRDEGEQQRDEGEGGRRQRGGGYRGRGGVQRGRGGVQRGRGGGQNRRDAGAGEEEEGAARGYGGKFQFKELIELKSRDASDIILTLSAQKRKLTSLLNGNLSFHMARVTLCLLAKSCQTTTAKSLFLELLTTVYRSKFLKETLVSILSGFAAEATQDQVTDDKQFLKDLLTLLQQLAISLPSSIVVISGLQDVLKMTVAELENKVSVSIIDDEISQMLSDLDGMKDNMFTRVKNNRKEKKLVMEIEEEPPDDFRQFSVFPTREDIHLDGGGPFLRRNKAMGEYNDLSHYLDVQFRLLREDFICPLREGIDAYLQADAYNRMNRNKDIRLYSDVRILRSLCARRDLLYRLEFDVSKLKRVRWENSKRLIYGSLVCLSHDNFNTYLFATVSDRDPKLLADGIIDVQFEADLEEDRFLIGERRYVMVETTAYFEAYKHVLAGLQQIRDGQLPFEKHIIKCESQVQPPQYIQNRRSVTFDLRPLVDEDMVIREDNALRQQRRAVSYAFSREARCAESVDILDLRDWPSPAQLHLDDSQYRALQTALTKEFVVTQGPPGTGKTYVGLKIVKALLHNSSVWNPQRNSPMLIVCYTNHALDQFLEGIDSFFKGNIIRVGARSVSEQISKYSLKEKKRELRKSRNVKQISHLRYNLTKELKEMQLYIEKKGAQIEASAREIVHEDMLKPFMDDFYSDMRVIVLSGHFQGRSVMVEWLGLDQMFGEVQEAVANGQDDDDVPNIEQNEEDEEVAIQEEAEILQLQRRLEFDDDDDDDPIRQLEERIKSLPAERSQYVAFDISNFDKKPQGQNKQQFQMQRKARKSMKRKLLKRLRETNRMTDAEKRRIENVWLLPLDERWRLYKSWVHQFQLHWKEQIAAKEDKYKEYVERLRELDMQEDKEALRTATVIGMTTTGAARYQQILREVRPKIIVVEEAAEVLEGHVITTLNESCQHLILIGDHKQLKPNPTVYRLAVKYHLDLSLFERMINNRMRCDTLEIQHRMRPEISNLMRHIYPNLRDHESVKKYPRIKGVSQNIFFIAHNEEEKHDTEMMSHSNEFEAKYVTEFCTYLLKQGYDKSQITVLTTYSGQLLALKKLMPKKFFGGLRITVVDNFQGEENEIIILSLVRSNSENRIGFLNIENRVCVALSRAKHGLYVIGNFDLLADQSELWRKLVKDRRENNQIGPGLKFFCQNHPNDPGFVAVSAEDFKKAPEGGCLKPCQFRLSCGHTCVRPCHPYDPQHLEYQCNKPCSKVICKNNHQCTRKCYQECGECYVKIEKIIPRCGHRQMVPCHLSPAEFCCTEPCTKMMSCGHKCGVLCGLPHQCTANIIKMFDCGHSAEIPCANENNARCRERCTSKLECGHTCVGNCEECHQGRLHVSCKKACKRILVCGHECRSTCNSCPPCEKDCENRCPHSKCPRKCGELCTPCMEPCGWVCSHHRCTRKCHEPCDREPCDQPCPKRLRCRHRCIGICGEPCPRLCRVCNRDEVTTIFFGTEDEEDARFVELEDCGHVLEVSGLDQWMESETHADNDDEKSIQLKCCPLCKTVIRQNMRYGKLIRERLRDIERVKSRVLGASDKIRTLQLEIEFEIKTDIHHYKDKQGLYDRGFKDSESGLVAIKNQLSFLKEIDKYISKFEKFGVTHFQLYHSTKPYLEDLKQFRKWILCKRTYVFSDQEISDAEAELERYKAALGMLDIKKTLKAKSIELDSTLERRFQKVVRYLVDKKPFTSERKTYVKSVFEEIRKVAPESGLGISESERVEIVKAMGLSQGHWFKCRNGHIYAIGDCGGATVESRCPECGAGIGGGNHQLRRDNQLAGEMDGARFAAWSEQNNLVNFQLDDLI